LLRLCGFPLTGSRRRRLRLPAASSLRTCPSSRVLPSDTYPTAAAIRPSHGLWLPTALEGFEVHHSRAMPARFVPSSGFGYPLDGLLPRIPGRFCFTPAALLGFALRRFPLPGGVHGVSTGTDPHTVSWAVIPPPLGVRPARPASVSRALPPESALRPRGLLGQRPPAPPLGFTPPGPTSKGLGQNCSQPPLTRFAGSGDYSPNPPASQSIDRPLPRPARQCTGVHTGRSYPHGVPAPVRS
jgi:hypothetical protein